jgi:hypothetical protein
LDLSSYSDVQITPLNTSQKEYKMKEKGKKLQIPLTKRTYEKPVLVLLFTKNSNGKNAAPSEYTTLLRRTFGQS